MATTIEIVTLFPKPIQTAVEEILRRDLLRMEQLRERLQEIDTIADRIASGEVVVVDFGPVVGYVCDGSNAKAKQKIGTLKHMESHLFALITTPELFPSFIDQEKAPSSFVEKARNEELPEAIHYRVATPLSDSLPQDCRSLEHGIPFIQIALFGEDASPELAYLIQTLDEKYGIRYVIATSANIHGETELSIYKKGQALAERNNLSFLNAGPAVDIDVIAGSFAGVHVSTEEIRLFRPGHHHPRHIELLFAVDAISTTTDMNAPRFSYPEGLDEHILAAIFSLPARLRLQLLYAYVHSILESATLR